MLGEKKEKKRCARCGFNKSPYALDIHHILTPVKKKRNGKTIVLCANCHRIEHWGTKRKKRPALGSRRMTWKYCETCGDKLRSYSMIKLCGHERDVCFKCHRAMEDFVFYGEGCPTSFDELDLSDIDWEHKRRDVWFNKKMEAKL